MSESRPPEDEEPTAPSTPDASPPGDEPGEAPTASDTPAAGDDHTDDEADAEPAAAERPAADEPHDQVETEPTAPEPADVTAESEPESGSESGEEAPDEAAEVEPDDEPVREADRSAAAASADAPTDTEPAEVEPAEAESGDEPARPTQPEAEPAKAAAEPAPQPAPPPASARPPRQRLAVRYRAAALIGVLVAALGFAIAVQVHANSQADSLSNLRADDLIGILDNQNARGDRLRQQIAELEQTLRRLQDSGDRNAAARQQAEQDAQALGVLLGTLPATGPGVTVRITDPDAKLTPEDLLDVVEELRGAGAEAIQFGSVRVSTATAFTTKDAAVAVDGAVQPPPYTVLAIGDPKTLDTALNIPGGVAAAVRAAGGELTVTEQDTVTIMVTRTLPTPKYASPASH